LRRDVAALSAHARRALEAAEYTPMSRSGEPVEDEDFAEYARLIRPEDD
jgi:hypothetical protein